MSIEKIKKVMKAMVRSRRFINIASLVLYILLIAVDAHAEGGSIEEVIRKFAKLLRFASLIIGWGLGFMFCVAGIMDLMKKDDDPRAGGKGLKKIVGGVALASMTLLIDWMAKDFGLTTDMPSQM